MGLSSYHNSTLITGREVTPPTLEYTRDGYLATVTRAMIEQPCAGGCGKMVKIPLYRGSGKVYCRECRKVEVRCSSCGKVFKLSPSRVRSGVTRCKECGGSVGDGKRGKVAGFSRASSRRLAREVSRVRLNARMNFVTLTFSDEFPYHDQPDQWQRHLKMFENRFRRAFPKGSYVWKREVEIRKSGDRTGRPSPHYHLLVFGVSHGNLRQWVIDNWHDVAGYGDPDHLAVLSHPKSIERVRSSRQVRQYAAKRTGSSISSELAKSIQALNNGESVGRWWGIVGRALFEALKSIIHTLAGEAFTERHAIILLRLFRKMARLGSRSYYKLNCFIDGRWLFRNLTKILEPVGRDRFKVTGRRYNEPFWSWAYESGRLTPGGGV